MPASFSPSSSTSFGHLSARRCGGAGRLDQRGDRRDAGDEAELRRDAPAGRSPTAAGSHGDCRASELQLRPRRPRPLVCAAATIHKGRRRPPPRDAWLRRWSSRSRRESRDERRARERGRRASSVHRPIRTRTSPPPSPPPRPARDRSRSRAGTPSRPRARRAATRRRDRRPEPARRNTSP